MDFLTKTVSSLFRPRLKQIDTRVLQAGDVQRRQLHDLLNRARLTEWGKKYDYRSISDYRTFAERLPLQDYEAVKPYVRRMIDGEKNLLWPGTVRWFAKSSGTTNDKSKYLPVTADILKNAHYRGPRDLVALYLRQNPASRFFSRKGLILGGSHAPSPLNAHAHCGDLSAVLLQNITPLAERIRVPEKKIILMDEWESKIRAIVESTWREDVCNLSGVPSWMLVLLKAILERAGKQTLTEVWPNLEVFFHGGVSFAPYRSQYRALIPSDDMHYLETYNASEGFFALQDTFGAPGMLLMPDYGIFYEFIPLSERGKEQPAVLPLEAVEPEKEYEMVITTCGGLWRYRIGDTVRFLSVYPHRLVITGRTKHYINAFGEELMVANADKALARTCVQTGAKVKEYTVAPLFLLDRAKGRHQWFIEFEKAPASIAAFAALLDRSLQEVNSDYEAKRYKEISLQPLEIITGRPGVFYTWLKRSGKLGGQHKIPRLSNERVYLEALLAINREAERSSGPA